MNNDKIKQPQYLKLELHPDGQLWLKAEVENMYAALNLNKVILESAQKPGFSGDVLKAALSNSVAAITEATNDE